MGKQVQVRIPYVRVWLYEDGIFDAGAVVTLTDAEYTQLGTAGQSRVDVLNASVADPVRHPVAGAGTGGTDAGALQIAANLSDLASASAARANLGLGSAATQASTAFDATGAAATAQSASLQKSANLSDLPSTSAARTNLGLGTAATQASTAFDAAGTASSAASTAQSAAIASSAQRSANLSDLASASGARTNLGLGTAATQPTSAFDAAGAAATAQSAAVGSSAQKAANLSDLADAPTARTNLGLGSAATQASTAFDASGAAATAQSAAIASSAQRSANLSDVASASTARQNLSADVLDLPSYITAATKKFDSVLSMYNIKPTNMRRFKAAAAKAQGGVSALEIVWVAASFGAGALSATTWNRPKAPPMSMRNEMGRRGIPIGGTGMVRFADSGATALDPRVAYTGTGWNANSKWVVFTGTQNDLVTCTSDLPGDHVKITYWDIGDASTFTVSVDGASSGAGFTTVTDSGGPTGMKSVVLTTPVKVGSTIVVKKTSAGGVMELIGWQVYNSTVPGVIVHNLSQSGSTASGTGTTAWADTGTATALGHLLDDLTKITASGNQPALVVIDLGTNDIKTPTSATDATVTAALTTIKNRFSSSDVLFIFASQVEDSLISAARWEAFGQSLYTYAEGLDVPVHDIRARLGNYTTVVANGQSTDGIGHVLAEVSDMLGRMLGTALALEFGNVDTPQVVAVPTGTTGFASKPDGTIWIEYTP